MVYFMSAELKLKSGQNSKLFTHDLITWLYNFAISHPVAVFELSLAFQRPLDGNRVNWPRLIKISAKKQSTINNRPR